MGFDVKNDPSAGGQLKQAYCKIIQPFEQYRLKHDGKLSTPYSTAGMRQTPSLTDTTGQARESTPLNVTVEQVQAASDRLNIALNASPAPAAGGSGSQRTLLEPAIDSGNQDKSSTYVPGDACEICKSDEDEVRTLTCGCAMLS